MHARRVRYKRSGMSCSAAVPAACTRDACTTTSHAGGTPALQHRMHAGRVRYKIPVSLVVGGNHRDSGQFCGAAVPAAHAGGTPALQGAPQVIHLKQPRKPSITPTSRKVAVGVARRGFPRAGVRARRRARARARISPNVPCRSRPSRRPPQGSTRSSGGSRARRCRDRRRARPGMEV